MPRELRGAWWAALVIECLPQPSTAVGFAGRSSMLLVSCVVGPFFGVLAIVGFPFASVGHCPRACTTSRCSGDEIEFFAHEVGLPDLQRALVCCLMGHPVATRMPSVVAIEACRAARRPCCTRSRPCRTDLTAIVSPFSPLRRRKPCRGAEDGLRRPRIANLRERDAPRRAPHGLRSEQDGVCGDKHAHSVAAHTCRMMRAPARGHQPLSCACPTLVNSAQRCSSTMFFACESVASPLRTRSYSCSRAGVPTRALSRCA